MTAALRSLLFVPAVRPDRVAKALASGADAVVIDLEDAVDATRKAEAREQVRAALQSPRPDGGPVRFVRINAAGSPWQPDDLALVASLGRDIDGVVVPKVGRPDDLRHAAEAAGSLAVIPLIETARGVLDAAAIAAAHPGAPAILFGAEDLTAEMGIPRTVAGEELIHARSQVVLAATSIGADAIDAVFIDIASPDLLREDATRARALGFRGKMAIHPSQIPIIHEVFTPSTDEIDRARRLVDAFAAARARGDAVLRLDDRMIDAPIVTRARRVLARAGLTVDR